MFRNNLKAYGFYLAVLIFAVAVYYEFMVLKYEPSFLKAKDIIVAARSASSVTSIILVVFLFFFIWYSGSFFLKQRKNEIAIYSLMGISSRKIGRIFAIESLFSGVTAICLGLGIGILFSRLFLMAVTRIALLDVSVSFSIPAAGVKELLLVFGISFIVLSVSSYISVARCKLIDLIRDAQKEETEPKFKAIRAILSLLLIAAGYMLRSNILLAPIVVMLVSAGTYWLFGALLPTIAKFLASRKSVLYKGVRIVSINNFTYRIKGNYRSLAMLAIMTATTITAFGTSLSLKYYVEETHHIEFPYSFSYVLNDKKTDDRVTEAIQSSKHRLLYSGKIEYVRLKANIEGSRFQSAQNFNVVRYSDFLRVSRDLEKQYPGKVYPHKEIKGKETILVTAPATIGGFLFYEGQSAVTEQGSYEITQRIKTPLFGSGVLEHYETMIVTDEEFEKLAKGMERKIFNGYIVSDAKHSVELAKSLMAVMPEGTSLFTYAAKYMGTVSFIGLFYFLGSFMSIVFILSTGSIMYFKILSEGLADRGKYDILKKIGMTRREIIDAVAIQVGLSLVLPLAVGIVHSLFAIDVLRGVLDYSLVVPTLWAIIIYILFYGLFYIATTQKFMRMVYRG